MVATAIIGAAVIGGGASIAASSSAAGASKDAAAAAAATQQRQYDQTRADLAPYRDSGSTALGQLYSLYGFGGPEVRDQAMSLFEEDPGAAYAREQTERQVLASRAAQFGGQSGSTVRGLTDRLYNLSNAGYNTYLSRLQDLSNVGQNAAAQTGNFGANAAGGIANAQLAAGNATAGGYINSANSFNNTLSNLAGAYGAYKGGAFGTPGGASSISGGLHFSPSANYF